MAHAPAVASEVEAALAALSDSKEYAAKARSLLFNLLKNDELRKTVLLRQLSAEQLVRGIPRPTGRRLPARPYIFRLSNSCLFCFPAFPWLPFCFRLSRARPFIFWPSRCYLFVFQLSLSPTAFAPAFTSSL